MKIMSKNLMRIALDYAYQKKRIALDYRGEKKCIDDLVNYHGQSKMSIPVKSCAVIVTQSFQIV